MPPSRARHGGRDLGPVPFGDLFTRPDVLTQKARSLLAARLGGGPTVGVGDDGAGLLGELPLGDVADPKRRLELKGWFESALALGWERRVARDVSLGDLVPPARLVPDSRLGPRHLDARSRSALEHAGIARWSVLLDSRLTDLTRLPELGPVAAGRALGACLERGLMGLAAPTDPAHIGELGVLLENERRSAHQPILESILDAALGAAAAGGTAGDAVGRSASRLLAKSAPWALEYRRPLLELLHAVADDQDRSIFVRAEIESHPASLTEMAAELAVSSTRIAQRRDRAAGMIRDELAASPAPLEWVVGRVRRSLGVVARREVVLDTVDRLCLEDPDGGSEGGRAASLLLWLAGPYRRDPRVKDWLVAGTDDLIAGTRAELREDGGVRGLSEMMAWLGDQGVAERMSVPWIQACGGTVVDGELCVWSTGNLPDVLERLIDAHGHGVNVEDCRELLRTGGRVATVEDLTRAFRSRRFRTLAGNTFGLATWPDTPPDGGTRGPVRGADTPPFDREEVAAAERHCAEPDGENDGAQLTLPGIAGLGPVEKIGLGSVQYGQVQRAANTSRSVKQSDAPERAWWSVVVDAALLHGADAPVPDALVAALGVGWRQRRTFASRYGPVMISNDGAEPMRGPLRPLALGAGAELGDSLALGFAADGGVLVEVHRAGGDPLPPGDSDAGDHS